MVILSLQTERLLLRPFTLDDAADYWPLLRDPQILRFTGEQPVSDLEGVREILRTRPLADYQQHGYGRMACVERASGRLIGFSGLKYLEDLDEVDIGYRFVPDAWGKGYATESARPLLEYGLQQLRLRRVIGLVMPQNQASARVLVKLGLRFEQQISVDDHAQPLDLYAIEEG